MTCKKSENTTSTNNSPQQNPETDGAVSRIGGIGTSESRGGGRNGGTGTKFGTGICRTRIGIGGAVGIFD